jgi:hypothetical protein
MRTELQRLAAELPSAGIARAGRLGLELAPQLEQEAWRGLVTHLARLTRTTTGARQTLTAWLGDALAYGEIRYRGRIATCASEAGLEPGTLRNAKMVCSRIPVSCRHDALSWTHHCEVGLAFSDHAEIEHWLAIAEYEKLSTSVLRKRIRAHLVEAHGAAPTSAALPSADGFRLMRDLRATGRRLSEDRAVWQRWSPEATQVALQELLPLVEFIDALRARALEKSTATPRDPAAN